jgi:hypothetical protein
MSRRQAASGGKEGGGSSGGSGGRGAALSAEEREVIIGKTDADGEWSIYTNSRKFRGMLIRVARRWGRNVTVLGSGGVEVSLPIGAVALRGPRGRAS